MVQQPYCANQSFKKVVGIADMAVSADPNEILVTHSLGSCIGLVLYDPVARTGGMLHCMLPSSLMDKEKARTNPYMFADTGISSLLQNLFDLGCSRDRMVARVAGAATVLDDNGMFRIGKRNYTITRKVLWKNGILIENEDIGGAFPRTMYLQISCGKTLIRSKGATREL